MLATEHPTVGAAERQAIIRETEQLQALGAAMQAGKPLDFRAVHDVASRIAKAAAGDVARPRSRTTGTGWHRASGRGCASRDVEARFLMEGAAARRR
jgi:hypothetical protein